MTKVSYAQNYEDIMLWRALKHVENGFYVDVGANDSIIDSVTKFFYDIGWNGINIDPVEKYIEKYLDKRPRDISIAQAISSEKGVMKLWQCDVAGWSTLDKEVASMHEADGHNGYWSDVNINTLTALLDEHVSGDIHFLKVDVEGAEYQVLKGNDWTKYRPWIVLIEATIPNSQVSDYDECETLLISNEYHHVYSDGLNRYYVANEHDELDIAFTYPPNVFDDFISYRESELQAKLDDHYQRMITAINDASSLIEKNQQGNNAITDLKKEKERLFSENVRLKNENRRLSGVIIDFENDYKKKNIEILSGEEKKEKNFSRQKNKLLQKLNATLEEVEDLEGNIKLLNAKIDELNRHSHFWWENAQRRETELKSIYASRTWKYATLPRRIVNKLKIKAGALKAKIIHFLQRVKHLSKNILKSIALKFLQNAFLRRVALSILARFPSLKNYLKRKYISTVVNDTQHDALELKDNIKTNQIKNVIMAKLRNR